MCVRRLVRAAPVVLAVALSAVFAACGSPAAPPALDPQSAMLNSVTPQPGLGQVIGRLVYKTADGDPYVGGDLYLGSLLPMDGIPDAPPVVAFSTDIEPRAQYNAETGEFAFVNVKPGKYALLIYDPYTSFVIPGPDQGMTSVTVVADTLVDMKTVVVP